ncbi:STAS domain-containing protein [Streptomyces sp. NPDC090306]|uniref:STAS domain-containing protein n=1 Tax=unclassified Streptomyces TaxID=2593676 RepID=UPI0036E3ADC7
MSDTLRVTVRDEGRLAVVGISGELDEATAGSLHTEIVELLETHTDLVLDMSAVTFCDSSGFNALLRIRRRTSEAGGWLALAGPPPQVSQLLALISGDEPLFDVHPSLDRALTAYKSR